MKIRSGWGPMVCLGLVCLALVCLGSSTAMDSLGAQTGDWRRQQVVATGTVEAGGTKVRVEFAAGETDLKRDEILRWVERAAQAVSVYYGRFPVRTAGVLIEPESGNDIHGTTWGGVRGVQGFTRVRLGQHVTQEELSKDWVMTHEFVHTAFPDLPDQQHWVEEGLATYIEPIARAQAGQLPPEKVWGDMMRGMTNGEPEDGDRGLNQTHTWGRTYWGGAMFCLVADVTIRRQTHNRMGLQDALRAIVDGGGTIDTDWGVSRAFSVGDRATGTTVLSDMYAQWSTAPVHVDLQALWTELGVRQGANGVVFDEKAPLAAVRKAITSPESTPAQRKSAEDPSTARR